MFWSKVDPKKLILKYPNDYYHPEDAANHSTASPNKAAKDSTYLASKVDITSFPSAPVPGTTVEDLNFDCNSTGDSLGQCSTVDDKKDPFEYFYLGYGNLPFKYKAFHLDQKVLDKDGKQVSIPSKEETLTLRVRPVPKPSPYTFYIRQIDPLFKNIHIAEDSKDRHSGWNQQPRLHVPL